VKSWLHRGINNFRGNTKSDGNQTPVQSAFEQLLEETEEVFADVNAAGSDAFKSGNYDRAKALLERAEQLRAFRDKVVTLRQEGEAILPPKSANISPRLRRTRLRKGLRTPEAEYYRPILQALDEQGGSGNTNAMLQRVRAHERLAQSV
jgi:restriction system protein